MKISLLVPTRNRFVGLMRMWESAVSSANSPGNVEFVLRVDVDDIALEDLQKMNSKQIKVILGSRKKIQSELWNECCSSCTGEICMLCADDIVFQTPSWDKLVIEEFEKFPDRILYVYGFDGIKGEELGTHGFIHQNWIRSVGYFVPPYFWFAHNDLWLTDVSKQIGRARYLPNLFIEHLHYSRGASVYDDTYSWRRQGQEKGVLKEERKLYNHLRYKRNEDVEKLKGFISSFSRKESE